MRVIKLYTNSIRVPKNTFNNFLFEKDDKLFIYGMSYGVNSIYEAEEILKSYFDNINIGGNGDRFIPVSELNRFFWLNLKDTEECLEYERMFKRKLKLKRILNEN